jgi:hypothetical protein
LFLFSAVPTTEKQEQISDRREMAAGVGRGRARQLSINSVGIKRGKSDAKVVITDGKSPN